MGNVNRTDLTEIISNGENSGVEFKRDDSRPDSIAREMSALLNFEGGLILLGVEDNGGISGLTRSREETERWVMEIACTHVQPEFIPSWHSVTFPDGACVGVIRMAADGPGKPYKAKRGSYWVTFVRVGSTSREATRDEEGRLYQSGRLMRYEIKPVLDMGLDSLDRGRLNNYFRVLLQRDAPSVDDHEAWRRLLLNTGLLVEAGGMTAATVAGVLLFGENPNYRVPQAGITATAFPRTEKDYDTVDEDVIRGPLVSMMSERGRVEEKGVIDRGVDFVSRNLHAVAWLEGGRRIRKKALPLEAVREAIVNAVVHRDYTLVGTDIEVSMYRDRLEVISPGRLPNSVTVEKMREGVLRVSRNELVKDVLRDYGYVEHLGMGVRKRIIEAMRVHNGTEPDLVEEEHRFTVRLWKDPGNHPTKDVAVL